MSADTPIAILLCALGGEGGGVLSEWLYDTAVRCGHSAQATSIPGVAQRTGATTYYVEVFPRPDTALGARRPVFSLNPVPGAIDLLVSSELLETVRQIGLGMAGAERTVVISSSARALTVAEKMQPADGRLSDEALLAVVQGASRRAEVADMTALAREAGTAISAVLLGAIAASGALPFARDAFEATIRAGGKGVEASLRGFAQGYEATAPGAAPRAVTHVAATTAANEATGSPTPPLDPALAERFPPSVHELLALGHARVAEYQDAAYAALYVDRLSRVLDAERAADPAGEHDHAITREAARWLALWMAFDDIVRVAHLKLAAARWQRVRREVGARDDEIVKVYDHFKPGVPEVAALLPRPLAERLMRWDAARRARGLDPWAWPVKIGAHTVTGALALRAAASLKGLRRRGSRYALEQSLIEQWLAALLRGTAEAWPLGHELAQCGRLIKGYGSTNERGKASLLHIVEQLAAQPGRGPLSRAEAIRAARAAALADDSGRALDAALATHGAAPRAPREQPVRWYKRRPDMPVEGVTQRP